MCGGRRHRDKGTRVMTDEHDDDEARIERRRRALWERELRSQGVKAWCSGRESRENNDPIQEPNLKRIDRNVSPEVGDLIAIGSVEDGHRIVRVTKIDLKAPNPVRWFAIEPVTAEENSAVEGRRRGRLQRDEGSEGLT
jgi:hypothetical protein